MDAIHAPLTGSTRPTGWGRQIRGRPQPFVVACGLPAIGTPGACRPLIVVSLRRGAESGDVVLCYPAGSVVACRLRARRLSASRRLAGSLPVASSPRGLLLRCRAAGRKDVASTSVSCRPPCVVAVVSHRPLAAPHAVVFCHLFCVAVMIRSRSVELAKGTQVGTHIWLLSAQHLRSSSLSIIPARGRAVFERW